MSSEAEIAARLRQIENVTIVHENDERRSSEASRDGIPQAACVLQLCGWVVGVKWREWETPANVSPQIALLLDRFEWHTECEDDERRARLLRPLIGVVLNTWGSPALEERRRWAAADWAWRTAFPELLRLHAEFSGWADELVAAPAVVDEQTGKQAYAIVRSAFCSALDRWTATFGGDDPSFAAIEACVQALDGRESEVAAALSVSDVTMQTFEHGAADADELLMELETRLAYPDDVLRAAVRAAEKVELEGKSFPCQREAADAVVTAFLAGRHVTDLIPGLRAIRDRHDAAWVALVRQLVAMTETG